jgi:hypothetical protein
MARAVHGMWSTPTYASWADMLSRCRNPKGKQWKDYGGRGIRVCRRWLKFENFVADMGLRPKGRTLDRVDNDRNYTPANCRWATRLEQQNNQRRNVRLSYGGQTKTLAQWARQAGVSRDVLRGRVCRRGVAAAFKEVGLG